MPERVIEYRVDEAPLSDVEQVCFAQHVGPLVFRTHESAAFHIAQLNPWAMANAAEEFRAGVPAK